MGVKTDRATSRYIAVLFSALLIFPIFVSAGGSKELSWGPMGQVTDTKDTFTSTSGNLMGYIDKGTTTAVYQGRMYVAWETSERKKGGTMIYVRSLKGNVWGPIEAVAGAEDGIVDTDPSLAVNGESLYLAWQHAGSDDTNIMCKALTDGSWSDCGYISPADNHGMDEMPQLISYDGDLWAGWVTHSVVTGKDNAGDIALRRYTGVDWENPVTIVNPTPANGYDSQPRLAVYRDKLVVTWVTRDGKIKNGTDMDVVLRGYDGSSWGKFYEVTNIDGKDDDDSYPTVAVFLDKLHIFWQGPGGQIGDSDIMMATWDDNYAPAARRSIGTPHNLAPDEHPFAKVHEGKLYVVWNSADVNLTTDADDDIAIVYFESSDITSVEEVTPDDMEDGRAVTDRFPVLESYGSGLYCIWEADDQRPSNNVIDPSDLFYRRYPPGSSKIDYTMAALIIITVILVMAFVAYWYFGPRKMSAREKRYHDRKYRQSLKVGPEEFKIRKRGGRKRRGRR